MPFWSLFETVGQLFSKSKSSESPGGFLDTCSWVLLTETKTAEAIWGRASEFLLLTMHRECRYPRAGPPDAIHLVVALKGTELVIHPAGALVLHRGRKSIARTAMYFFP